ncbi:unnamed protein product, partial [Symbiodinium sp. CCMP2592]
MAMPAPEGVAGGSLQALIGNLSAAAQALASAAGTGSTRSYDSAAKLVKSPDVFAPKSLEEEVSQWPDWSFSFKVFVGFIDPTYAEELKKVELAPPKPAEYTVGERERSTKLYAILASYLRNRPLKLLKSEGSPDGYSVWRRLFEELEPSSRTRGLAMAQALVSFSQMTKGTSILDYLLTYEKLVAEYEKLSEGKPYDENLKIGTVLKGLPNELRKHILIGLTPTTKYADIRKKLLEYERSTQSWNAENILQSFNMESATKNTPYNGPQPVDIDRVEEEGTHQGDHEKSSSSNAPATKNETGQVRQITAEAARQARRVEMTEDEDEELNFVRLCQEFEELVEGELRRVEEFDISSNDEEEESEEEPTDGLMEWYQGWMCIRRLEEEEMKVQPVRLERELKNELKSKEDEDGWFVLNDGTPARFDWYMGKTFDPTGQFPNRLYEGEGDEGDYFPYRTTLLGKLKRSGERVLNEVGWKSMDFFECTEIWKDRERVQLGASPQDRFEVMVTLLEKGMKEPSDYGLLTNLEELERELAQEGVPMEVTGTSTSSKEKEGREPMDDESDDDDDDPGEVRTKRKAEDELVPDEMTLEEFQREVAKRNAEEEGEGSPKKGPRVDEGTGEVEERVEKVPRLGDEARGSAARVEYHIRRFAKSEDPEEHGDEYVDLDETQLFLEESREFQSKWNEKVCETEEDLTDYTEFFPEAMNLGNTRLTEVRSLSFPVEEVCDEHGQSRRRGQLWIGSIYLMSNEHSRASALAAVKKVRDKTKAKKAAREQAFYDVNQLDEGKGCMTAPTKQVTYDMSSFVQQAIDRYKKLAGPEFRNLNKAATPFYDDKIARPVEAEAEIKGKLAPIASRVKLLFAARMARFDLLRAVQ